jgi:hypothetical protein
VASNWFLVTTAPHSSGCFNTSTAPPSAATGYGGTDASATAEPTSTVVHAGAERPVALGGGVLGFAAAYVSLWMLSLGFVLL